MDTTLDGVDENRSQWRLAGGDRLWWRLGAIDNINAWREVRVGCVCKVEETNLGHLLDVLVDVDESKAIVAELCRRVRV